MSAALALAALVATLAAAIAGPRRVPDWAVAAGSAALLVLAGAISSAGAREALEDLGPTVAFAAALLVLADGCRRAGLFAYLGAAMAAGAHGRPRRLLGLVFVVAASTTAVLSLDATVVLLTPVVFATASRLRFSARPHVYACTHLANSASLLLPVSNLTNLLAFDASGLSFTRFAALMALPWLAAIAIEWAVLSRAFRAGARARAPRARRAGAQRAAGVRARPCSGPRWPASWRRRRSASHPLWAAVAGAAPCSRWASAPPAARARRLRRAGFPRLRARPRRRGGRGERPRAPATRSTRSFPTARASRR